MVGVRLVFRENCTRGATFGDVRISMLFSSADTLQGGPTSTLDGFQLDRRQAPCGLGRHWLFCVDLDVEIVIKLCVYVRLFIFSWCFVWTYPMSDRVWFFIVCLLHSALFSRLVDLHCQLLYAVVRFS